MKPKPVYADLHKLSEDDRIALICQATAMGKVCSVVVEDDGEKGDRYAAKILKQSPGLKIERAKGPAAGMEVLRVSNPNNKDN